MWAWKTEKAGKCPISVGRKVYRERRVSLESGKAGRWETREGALYSSQGDRGVTDLLHWILLIQFLLCYGAGS